jgi:Holliday junction resolvasome RuvABC endonuclease subunit
MRFVVGSVQPDLIVLEDYAIGGSHAKAIIPTCEWGGVLRLELFDLSVPFIVVPPQAIKSYCTGKGNAGKDEVGYELSTRTGIVFRNKDESDAFGLGAMVNDHYGNPWVSVPKAWRESAFKQVQWPEGVKDAKTHP